MVRESKRILGLALMLAITAAMSEAATLVWDGVPPGLFVTHTGVWTGDTVVGETKTIISYVNQGRWKATSATGFENAGTIDLQDYGYVADLRDGIEFAISSGQLLNTGLLDLHLGTTYGPDIWLLLDLLNEAGGTVDATGGSSRPIRVIKANGVHENRGTWNIDNAAGMALTGDGVQFFQVTAGASLSVTTLVVGANGDSTGNVVELTEGDIEGTYILYRTDLTLGPNLNPTGPTVLNFRGDNVAGGDAGLPTGVLRGDVPADITVLLRFAGNASQGSFVSTPGSLTNDGTIAIEAYGHYQPNGAYGRLTVAGTLTNQGTLGLNSSGSSVYGAQRPTLIGDVDNTAGGLLRVASASTNPGSYAQLNGNLVTSGTYDAAAGYLVVNGSVTLGGTLTSSAASAPASPYLVLDNDGADAINGTFDNQCVVIDGMVYEIQYNGGSGNDVVLVAATGCDDHIDDFLAAFCAQAALTPPNSRQGYLELAADVADDIAQQYGLSTCCALGYIELVRP